MNPPDARSRPAPAYELEFPPTAIHDAPASAADAPVRPDPVRDAWAGTAGGERRNGRTPVPLTPGHWKVAGTSDLADGIAPENVVVAGDRVVVQGRLLWQLFATDGREIAKNAIAGGVTVDRERGCFYAPDPTGPLKAWTLADGKLRFIIEPFFGADYDRTHVSRHGDALRIASVERDNDPHRVRVPNLTAVEVQRVPESPEVNRYGFLETTERTGTLMMNSATLRIAGSEHGLVLAGRSTIYLPDSNLAIHAALRGEFEPLALSLDERDRIDLVGRQGGRSFLWRLERDGRRLFACELPPIEADELPPPAIGFDHRSWIRTGEGLAVVGPDGRLLASVATGRISGLTVTSDGWALITEDSTIVAARPAERGAKGPALERHVLFTCPDGALLGPAILAPDGTMWCASARRLYHLHASLD